MSMLRRERNVCLVKQKWRGSESAVLQVASVSWEYSETFNYVPPQFTDRCDVRTCSRSD
jgi:hypothetical protein